MNAIVTGCAGFIGSHLTERLLKEGFKVVGIDNFSDFYPKEIKEKNLESVIRNPEFMLRKKDMLDMELSNLVKDADYIFHLAAQPGVRPSWGENFEIYVKNNILATQKLLEACKGTKIKKFIYASSSSVYGDVELPMREDARPNPISPYGVSKLAGEHLCNLYSRSFYIPTISLRYFSVYGERQRPDMAFHKFIKSALDGKEITIYSDGNQTRDFTYISDVIDATVSAMKGDELEGEVINVGGGCRISVNEVIKILEHLLKKEIAANHIQKQKGDVVDTLADICKAQEFLNYHPKVKIEEGLKKEIEWIKSLSSSRA